MYDKQLDSGRGTLLHLCDDVIQQEVKEVILAYFILMTQGKATEEVHSSFKLSLSWGWVPWSRGDLLCIDTFHFCKAGSGSPL
jgi:hypothetical protein